MKKKIPGFLICVLCVLVLIPMTVHADIGPKPSVRIIFEGLGDELCYGTLLSERKTTGPSTAWDGMNIHARHNENENYYYAKLDYKTWKAFVDYEDSDGYYFLQEGWQVNETKELAWTYYPPSPFKILLYFPESNTYAVSGIYERYAFDSYFTVDMAEIDMSGVKASGVSSDIMVAVKSYDYTWESISLVARIVITILLELAIAILFGYWAKKQVIVIVGANAVTQVVLNVLLNIANYNLGSLWFTINYFLLEIVVFTVEAIFFGLVLHKLGDRPKKSWIAVLYAFVANVLSFVTGFGLAKIIPGIF